MILYEENPTIDVYELVQEIALEYPTIPLDFLIRYMLRAAIEACRAADLDRRFAIIEVRPYVETYLIQASDGSELVAILKIECTEGGDINRTIKRFPHKPAHPGYHGVGTWIEEGNILHIDSGSHLPSVYRVEYSVSPNLDTRVLRKEFKDKYYEILYNGIKYFVHSNTGPLFNLQLAMEYKRLFQSGYRAAKIEALRGKQRGTGRMVYKRIL
jgi:hypothetical protein